MFSAESKLKIKDFYGKDIFYSGIKFEGSPRQVYWSYFDPFFTNNVAKVLEDVTQECFKRGLEPKVFVLEAAELLKIMVSRLYEEISLTDQILCGNGFPTSVAKKDVSKNIESIYSYISKEVDAALLRKTPIPSKGKGEILKKYSLKIWGVLFAVLVGGGILSVQYKHYLEEIKVKKDLYINTKSLCDQLNYDYSQLIVEMIELEFSRVSKQRGLGVSCRPLERRSAKRKPIDLCLFSVDEGRKNLMKRINEIELNFDINKRLKDEMIHLRVSRFNDTMAFQKVRLTEIRDCNQLRSWRAGAQNQGDKYLEKWFTKPYSRLLNELKKQL